MNDFQLDPELIRDCRLLGKLNSSHLLLMDNAAMPWFVLVPITEVTELYLLAPEQQLELLEHINLLSRFIKNNQAITKINVATIGNIVSQLHIHIVGRHSSDYCWPGVVWGAEKQQIYTDAEAEQLVTALENHCSDTFTRI